MKTTREEREARKLEARRRIVAGENGAATWAVAIYGEADPDTVQVIAWQGVDDPEGACECWCRQLSGEL